ncbi:MAG: 30S ribosomal protein S18 [bacterium]
MQRKPFKRKFVRKKRPPRPCRFCTAKMEIDYKNVRVLRNYVGDNARILPSSITGTCPRHQRALTLAIKRARQIALLPYVM